MRRLQYYVATSLDGYIAREDGGHEFFVQEGDHVDDFWTALEQYDVVIMGRETYRIGENVNKTNPYPNLKTYVFSRSMKASPDSAVQLVREGAVDFVRSLKRGEGSDIYLCGGGKLAATLAEEKLIDDLIVKINPVLIGHGIPVIALEKTVNLELVAHKVYSSGVVLLHYTFKNQVS